MVNVGSWGRLGAWPHALHPLAERPPRALPRAEGGTGLAYGMGRSYGDVCLNPGGTLWPTRALDRFIAWDEARGLLTCEAGVLLRDIQRLFAPRGWLLPVTPGTQLVTVGGAIANDVHGKNHHVYGSFGDQVMALRLLRTDGERIDCGPDHRADWFAATVGGLGLTGVITQATLRLRRVPGPWLETETLAFESLDAFHALSAESEADWEHTVAWVDCLAGGRGLFLRARPTEAEGTGGPRLRQARMPFTPPVSLVNGWTLRPFNWAYYQRGKARGRAVLHYEPYLYPLDGLLEWNRMYGPRGFYQYQCVLPPAAARDGVRELLAEIARAGEGSFLAVLKTFGERRSPGLLSFPAPGVTLALDFPNRGDATLRLFDRLDAVVRAAGGRLYPAKDARMPADLFFGGYPAAHAFAAFRDPGIDSAFARRTLGAAA